jgi:RNA polymerase sigma factor (sigma-70 family)
VRLLPRERQVLTWRFGLKGSDEMSLQEIGDRMKLSRERIRQIQNGAFAKLRRQKGLRDLRVLISE